MAYTSILYGMSQEAMLSYFDLSEEHENGLVENKRWEALSEAQVENMTLNEFHNPWFLTDYYKFRYGVQLYDYSRLTFIRKFVNTLKRDIRRLKNGRKLINGYTELYTEQPFILDGENRLQAIAELEHVLGICKVRLQTHPDTELVHIAL